ncbi:MAG: SigE family RNA polymerase sigma factor [Marmoricola sp.]
MRGSDRSEEFIGFVRAHRDDLVRTAVLLCAGDEAFAEDVVQTTLTRMYLKWNRVRRADHRLAYARASLTNAFFDECRRAHRRRELPSADPVMVRESVRESGLALGDRHHDTELRSVVLSALDALGPRQRAVVVLRHWHDLDVAETARILGCSAGTVKSQNARALAHLRTVLGPLLYAEEAR